MSLTNSRSLDEIITEFNSNTQMQQLPSHQRKLILNQFKKMYSQQMSKVAAELNRRQIVKTNKNGLQQQEQKQIKSIQINLLKKMQEHDKKRQKMFSKKINQFKMIDENWKLKLEEIQRKKKDQYKQSLQKAMQYRKQTQTFWSENNQQRQRKSLNINADSSPRNNNSNYLSIPIVESQGYFSIKTQIQKVPNNDKKSRQHHQSLYTENNKRKAQSKNQIPSINKTFLPQIPHNKINKKYYLGNSTRQKNQETDNRKQLYHSYTQSQSEHRLVDDKVIQDHIQKSKNLFNQKEQFALQKALQKLKKIQQNRKRCKRNLQKNIKEAKLRRQLRQNPSQRVKRLQSQQQQVIRKSRTKNTQRQKQKSQLLENSGKIHLSRSRSGSPSLDQSIIQHKIMKQKLENQKFQQRGELLKSHLMKQKKGQMIRMVKQTVNKLKHQALKESS